MQAKFQYNLTDHLGNTRVTFEADENNNAVIVQENHYYSFGLQISGMQYFRSLSEAEGIEIPNNFLFNGKELQAQSDNYDYGFRQLDPTIGRWYVIDAMSEKFMHESPYNYAGNNPVNNIDLMGLTKQPQQESYFAGTEFFTPGGWGSGGGHLPESLTSLYMSSTSANERKGLSFMDWYNERRAEAIQNGYSNFEEALESGSYRAVSYRQYYAIGTEFKIININGTEVEIPFSRSVISEWKPGIMKTRWEFEEEEEYDFGRTGNILGIGGIAFDVLENAIANKYWWMDAKGNYNSVKILSKGSNGKFVRGVQGYRNGYNISKNAASSYRVAGNIVGVLGLGVTAVQWRTNQITDFEASVDAAFGIIGFIGPIGAGISATYFIGKLSYEYFSGETLFDKPE
jgi:RHS repeat-associated protein